MVLAPAQAHAPVMSAKERQHFMVEQLSPKQFARHLVAKRWEDDQKQFQCLARLWGKESAWNYKAKSPTHDYGIPQRHMRHNSAKQIKDFMKNHRVQIRWGLNYISTRYKTPCKALQFWLEKAGPDGKGGWY